MHSNVSDSNDLVESLEHCIKFVLPDVTFYYTHVESHLQLVCASACITVLDNMSEHVLETHVYPFSQPNSVYAYNDAVLIYLFNDDYDKRLVSFWGHNIYKDDVPYAKGNFPEVQYDLPHTVDVYRHMVKDALDRLTNEIHSMCRMSRQERKEYIDKIKTAHKIFLAMEDF